MHGIAHPRSLRAIVIAGVGAGIVSTISQIFLWIAFTDTFPGVLLRDAGYAAAIVLGPAALSAEPTPLVWVIATLIHFALSIAYSAAIALAVRRIRVVGALTIGAAAGAALYAMNMYGFTRVFPWFEQARDPITLVAHILFGIAAAFFYIRAANGANRAVTPRVRTR